MFFHKFIILKVNAIFKQWYFESKWSVSIEDYNQEFWKSSFSFSSFIHSHWSCLNYMVKDLKVHFFSGVFRKNEKSHLKKKKKPFVIFVIKPKHVQNVTRELSKVAHTISQKTVLLYPNYSWFIPGMHKETWKTYEA